MKKIFNRVVSIILSIFIFVSTLFGISVTSYADVGGGDGVLGINEAYAALYNLLTVLGAGAQLGLGSKLNIDEFVKESLMSEGIPVDIAEFFAPGTLTSYTWQNDYDVRKALEDYLDGKVTLEQLKSSYDSTTLTKSLAGIGTGVLSSQKYRDMVQAIYDSFADSGELLESVDGGLVPEAWADAMQYYRIYEDHWSTGATFYDCVTPCSFVGTNYKYYGLFQSQSIGNFEGCIGLKGTASCYMIPFLYYSGDIVYIGQANLEIDGSNYRLQTNNTFSFDSYITDSYGKVNHKISNINRVGVDNCPEIIFGGLCFGSYADAQTYFNELLLGNHRTDLITNNPSVINQGSIGTAELLTANILEKILAGHNYVTADDMLKALSGVTAKSFSTTNDYVTDARQYITNTTINEGDTTINEGDTIIFDDTNIVSGINSVFNEVSNITSKLGVLGSAIELSLSWYEKIFNLIKSYFDLLEKVYSTVFDISKSVLGIATWDFPNAIDGVTGTLQNLWNDVHDLASDIPDLLSGIYDGIIDIPDRIGEILNELDIDIAFPDDWVLDLDFPDVIWPDWTWPELKWPDWTWPELKWPDWTWPELKWPEWVWPPWEWPELKWPELDWEFDWSKLFDWFKIDTSVIADAIVLENVLPDGFEEFKGIPTGFIGRYGNVDYPVFKMDTPEILQTVYPHSEIVLYDTQDHAQIFSEIRAIMSFCLMFGLCMWVIKSLRGQFVGGV